MLGDMYTYCYVCTCTTTIAMATFNIISLEANHKFKGKAECHNENSGLCIYQEHTFNSIRGSAICTR